MDITSDIVLATDGSGEPTHQNLVSGGADGPSQPSEEMDKFWVQAEAHYEGGDRQYP